MIGTLPSTHYMQEVNTISKEQRHKDFKNDVISRAMDSQHYRKVQKTDAEKYQSV